MTTLDAVAWQARMTAGGFTSQWNEWPMDKEREPKIGRWSVEYRPLYAHPPAPAHAAGEDLVLVPRDAVTEVLRISDRKHDAWDRVREAIAAAPRPAVEPLRPLSAEATAWIKGAAPAASQDKVQKAIAWITPDALSRLQCQDDTVNASPEAYKSDLQTVPLFASQPAASQAGEVDEAERVAVRRWNTVRQFADGEQFDAWEVMAKNGHIPSNDGNEYADRRADELAALATQPPSGEGSVVCPCGSTAFTRGHCDICGLRLRTGLAAITPEPPQ